MSFFGLRKWPTPVMKPLWPFAVASTLTFYLISKAQDAASQSEEYRSNPKNPYVQKIAAQAAHH